MWKMYVLAQENRAITIWFKVYYSYSSVSRQVWCLTCSQDHSFQFCMSLALPCNNATSWYLFSMERYEYHLPNLLILENFRWLFGPSARDSTGHGFIYPLTIQLGCFLLSFMQLQTGSALPAWFCQLGQILLIWSFVLDVCASIVGKYST